jgi:hypothetical protein
MKPEGPVRELAPRADRIAALADDQMARMRMVEAAAGLPRWTYSGSPRTILDGAVELSRQYPDIDPDWFARKDFRLREALFRGALMILQKGGEAGRLTAEEIVQNMGGGLDPSLRVKEDVYGLIGKKNARRILDGSVGPENIRPVLIGAAKNRAKDEYRDRMRRKKEREELAPTLLRTEEHGALTDAANTVIRHKPVEVMMHLLSSPAGRPFKNWLYKTLQRRATPVQLAILEAFLDNPEGSRADWGEDPRVMAVSQTGGPISSQAVSNNWKRLVLLAQKEMEDNRKILDWIDDYLELAQLGYGGGSLRASAKRVATRYLRNHGR